MAFLFAITYAAKQSVKDGLPRLSLVCLALSIFASACAQPTTQLPQISKAEQQEELVRQQETLKTAGTSRIDYESLHFSDAELAQMQQRLDRVVNRLAPQALNTCRELLGPTADCNMRVELSEKIKGVNAYADGQEIVISPAMMHFTRDEPEQLAFVLAHEYTHHFMGHVNSAQQNVMVGALAGILGDALASSQGQSTGGRLTSLGARMGRLSYSPGFEKEADYVGLYILERAGFATQQAPDFWRRMAVINPQGLYNRTTHPTTPERFVLMRKTIDEIKQKQQSGVRLLPNRLQKS